MKLFVNNATKMWSKLRATFTYVNIKYFIEVV